MHCTEANSRDRSGSGSRVDFFASRTKKVCFTIHPSFFMNVLSYLEETKNIILMFYLNKKVMVINMCRQR